MKKMQIDKVEITYIPEHQTIVYNGDYHLTDGLAIFELLKRDRIIKRDHPVYRPLSWLQEHGYTVSSIYNSDMGYVIIVDSVAHSLIEYADRRKMQRDYRGNYQATALYAAYR